MDKFDANVSAYAVAHAYGIMECVIMINDKNQIWAAVINENGDGIRCFTNVPEWKGKIPITIKNWANNFDFKNNIIF